MFVCCHQPTEVPDHPLLAPIQVGAALAGSHFAGFLWDDTGENISIKNRSYCELTAQYWAWKNVKADYYGFFHYRRYLYPDQSAPKPYRIEEKASQAALERLGYSRFEEVICQYDMLLPKGENMYLPVREHYANAPFHYREDLKTVEEIVRDNYSAYRPAIEEYLSSTICYFGNIFIMKQSVFQDYCAWLFPVLEEFDRRADILSYSSQEQRVDGYLAERLLGIYGMHHRGNLRMIELPRVHFIPDGRERRIKKVLNLILPPGSRRRSLVKQQMKR